MTHDLDAERTQLRNNAQKLLDGMTYTSRLRDTGLHDALAAFDAADGDHIPAATGALRVQMALATAGLVDIEYTDFIDNWDSSNQRFRPWSKYLTLAFIVGVIAWTTMTGYCTILFDQAGSVSANLAKLDIVAFSESKARLYSQAQRYGFDAMKLYAMGAVPLAPELAPVEPQTTDGADSKSAALVTFIHDLARLGHDYHAISSVIRNADQVTHKISEILSTLNQTRLAIDRVFDRIGATVEAGIAPLTRRAGVGLAACIPNGPNDPACPSSGTYAANATVPPLPFNSTVHRIDLFLQSSGLSVDNSIPNLVPGYQALLAYQMRVLGTWLLPAFYGTLGAGIFYLRRLLRANLPNPPVARVLTRMVLGGLAGVLVASFWTMPIAEGQNIATLSAFMLAFLFGYSIDIFFRLLDRLVYSVQKQIDSIDAPTQGK